MNKKPNVLFIVTDDQRFDTIHALGYETIGLGKLLNGCPVCAGSFTQGANRTFQTTL